MHTDYYNRHTQHFVYTLSDEEYVAWKRRQHEELKALECTPNQKASVISISFGILSRELCYVIFLATSCTPAGWLALFVGLLVTVLLFCLIKRYCETQAQETLSSAPRP